MKKAAVLLIALSLLMTMFVVSLPVAAEDDPYAVNGEAYLAEINDASNLALHKTVLWDVNLTLDQGAGAAWTPQNLTDGSLNRGESNGEVEYQGFHSNHPSGAGNTPPSTVNHQVWATVDLGAAVDFDTVVVYPARKASDTVSLNIPNAYAVEVSTDNENWTRVYEAYAQENLPAAPVTIQFEKVNARYVKFVGISLNYNGDGFYLKLSEMAVYNKGYQPAERNLSKNILANRPYVIDPSDGAHVDTANGYKWHPDYLINGDRYDMVSDALMNEGRNYGQFAGFHSRVTGAGRPDHIDYTISLEEGSKLDLIWIFPSTERYATTGDRTKFNIPAEYSFAVSDDGNNWTTVYETKTGTISEYKVIEIQLDQVYTANFLRFSMNNLTDDVKISELEAYDTTAGGELDLPELPSDTDTDKEIVSYTDPILFSTATDYSEGLKVPDDDGPNSGGVGGTYDGAWLKFAYDFGSANATGIKMHYCNNSSRCGTDSKVAIWIDGKSEEEGGKLLAIVDLAVTSADWNTFGDVEAEFASKVTGKHDVYFVLSSNTDADHPYVANLNNFAFKMVSSSSSGSSSGSTGSDKPSGSTGTGDVSMVLAILTTGVAAMGGLKLKKK